MIIHISGEPCPFNQSFQGTYHLSADRHWSPDLSALQHPGAQHTPCEWKGFKTKIGGLYELYIYTYLYLFVYELYDFSFIFVWCDLWICIYIYIDRDVICWLAHVLWDDGPIRFICSRLIQSTRRSFSTIEGYNLVATHFHTSGKLQVQYAGNEQVVKACSGFRSFFVSGLLYMTEPLGRLGVSQQINNMARFQ